MRTIKTGNELFDIFWQIYPPRDNKKKTKGPSLAWFEKNKPAEELVYDMVEWVKKDKANRELLLSQKLFCAPPKDAIRFLKDKDWMDEIGEPATKTEKREAHRGKAVYANNIKALISHWQSVILEWSDDKLRASKAFQSAWKYPEFREWVKKERANRTKADNPPLSQPEKAVIPVKKPTPDADLPPPRTEQERMVEEFVEKYKLK
jgi:hypothetical protein